MCELHQAENEKTKRYACMVDYPMRICVDCLCAVIDSVSDAGVVGLWLKREVFGMNKIDESDYMNRVR